MDDVTKRGIEALDVCCKALKVPYTIQRSFKKWGRNIGSCTITVQGIKAVTKRGDDAYREALKEIVLWMIETYSIFESVRKQNEEEKLEIEQTIIGLS